MKLSTVVLIIALPNLAFAQAGLYGKKLSEPLTLSNGVQVTDGDTIHLGSGTMPGGDFKYIRNPQNVLVGIPEQPMDHGWGGRYAIVNAVRVSETKKYGKKTYVVVSAGRNAMVEIEPAMETGEVVAINSKSVRPKQAGAASTPAASVADELLKLKQLLDAGAINQAEYDQQKKKLLGS